MHFSYNKALQKGGVCLMNILNIIKYCFKRNWNRRAVFIANLAIPILVVILGIFANNISQPSSQSGFSMSNTLHRL